MLRHKFFLQTVGVLFLLIAIVHGWRLFKRLPASIGTFDVPLWFSLVAFILALFLALNAFSFTKRH